MASEDLVKYVNGLGTYLQSKDRIEKEVIDALFQASQVAMFTENDSDYAMKCTKRAKDLLARYVYQETEGKNTLWSVENFCVNNKESLPEVSLYYNILKQESFYDFQSFMYYMERDRESAKRFYYPRRNTLKIVVDDLTKLENGDFEFYGLSLPPRVGKSTICIFFLNWVMLKRPNSHNAMCGHSGSLAKGFFKETYNLLTSKDYNFRELYEFWNPSCTLIRDKSAEDYTVTLDRPDRFATLTCRGIDGTWTGAVDISRDGYLYVDDLIRDREHSMSPQRMENTYQEYLNKVVDRKNDGARELMVGTLWSILDPLERIRTEYENDKRYFFRRLPALNERGQTNFGYDINGFSTKYYVDLKKRLDEPEWCAKYQQKPFVREGLLLPKDDLRYFDGIVPEGESTTVAVIDPAFGGGDRLSMPICMDYGGKRKYIVGWVYNKGTQRITVPLIVKKIIRHYITELDIEKNNGGQLLADNIKDEMERQGCYHCKITMTSAPNRMSKEDKITGYSDYVRENFVFLEPNDGNKRDGTNRYRRDKEYQEAMEEVNTYSPQSKGKQHDDGIDSLSQLAIHFEKKRNGIIEIVKNPFRGMH